MRRAALATAVALLLVTGCGEGSGESAGDEPQDREASEPADETVAPEVEDKPADEEDPQPPGSSCPPADGVEEPVRSFPEPPPDCLEAGVTHTAVFATTEGEIRVELDTERTPLTANNFAFLARYGYYDGTPIFRTDPSIGIIQGGGESPSDPGPGYTIPDEGDGFTYEPGQLVMARTAEPDSAGAQFFFVADENAALLDDQGTYVVFGVTDAAGLEVVRAILALHVPDPASGLGGAPSRPVTVESVTIEAS